MSIQNNKLPDNPNIEVIKAKQTGLFTNYIYKAIPLAFDETMSYYETLCGLLNYLKNTILPTLNNNADAVSELQSLYEELRTFVNDYFTNLDVQKEINNKLDALVEDGTLTTLIGNYIQPLIDEQNSEIRIFKNDINNDIDEMNTKIDATTSGSPLSATSTSDMTDTTRIYVNTTDGNWYYYNGSSWVIGGTYQSTSIADGSITRAKLNYPILGKLFAAGQANRKLVVSRNTTTNPVSVDISTSNTLYLCDNEKFYTIGTQTVSANITSNVQYVIVSISNNNGTIQVVSQEQYNILNKSTYYIIGIIYANTYHALLNKDMTTVKNFYTMQDKPLLISTYKGYINIDTTNNQITFNNIYVLYNQVITNVGSVTLSLSNLYDIQYIVFDGSTLQLKGINDIFDRNSIVAVFYDSVIYTDYNIRVKGEQGNKYELGTIILGSINVDTVLRKVQFKNIYLITPGGYNNYYSSTSEVIDLTIPTNDRTYNVLFDNTTRQFSIEDATTNIRQNNKIWLLSIFANNVYPMIDAKRITVNDIPYYQTVVNVQTNTAIELSMNDIFSELADKTNQTNITIVGDSIAHGQGGTGFIQNGDTIITAGSTTWKRNPNGYCWANIFKDYIENNYNAIVTNNACTGTDTGFLKAHISTLIPTNSDIVIICYGTNNRGLSTNDNYNNVYTKMISDFNSIIDYCNTNNIKYCICSPIPSSTSDEERVNGDNKRFVHLFQINNIIKSIASSKKCEYANMYNAINEYCRLTNTNWNNCLSDGLHPNDNGYKIMYYEYMYQFGLAPSYIDIQ